MMSTSRCLPIMSRLGRRQSHIGWHIGEWDVFINRNTEDIRPNGRLCRFNDQIEFAPSSASECVVRFFFVWFVLCV